MKQHYISLGYFCSVASDLECLGLRSESSPFDWLISDFEGVIKAIQNNFADFLTYDYLAQNRQHFSHYRNSKYKVFFFHDFSQYKPLKDQLPQVQEKYRRRIQRFYASISEPTLFIRYILEDQPSNGSSKELRWIEQNYDAIIALLKSFNEQNDILFIANDTIRSSKIDIHYVQRHQGDVVNRRPILDTPALLKLFESFDYAPRQNNIRRFKAQKYRRAALSVIKKAAALWQKVFLRPYIHEKQY